MAKRSKGYTDAEIDDMVEFDDTVIDYDGCELDDLCTIFETVESTRFPRFRMFDED